MAAFKLFIIMLKWQSDRSWLNIRLGQDWRTGGKKRLKKTRTPGLNGDEWGVGVGGSNVIEKHQDWRVFRREYGRTDLVDRCYGTFNNWDDPLGRRTAQRFALRTVMAGGSAGSTGNWTVAGWARTPNNCLQSPIFAQSLPCKCNDSVTIYRIPTHKWSGDDGKRGGGTSFKNKINTERKKALPTHSWDEVHHSLSVYQYSSLMAESLFCGGYLACAHTEITIPWLLGGIFKGLNMYAQHTVHPTTPHTFHT